MKLVFIFGCGILLYSAITFGRVPAEGNSVWFERRVTWQAGTEPHEWEASVASPNRKDRYQLALVPLWAVEGGIVAMEIVAARPEHLDVNLLGTRKPDVTQPFVISVEELEHGIKKSRYGSVRNFKLDHATLRFEIQESRLGEGVGDCATCKNIQEIVAECIVRGN